MNTNSKISTDDDCLILPKELGLSESGIHDLWEVETVQAFQEVAVQLHECGIMWSNKETLSLIKCKNEVMKSCGRIEFGPSVITLMAKVFSESKNLTGSLDDFVELMHQMCELFYKTKNDIEDHMGDLELITLMYKVYDDEDFGNGCPESTTEWLLSWLAEDVRDSLSAGKLKRHISSDQAFAKLKRLSKPKVCNDSGFADPDIYQWNHRGY